MLQFFSLLGGPVGRLFTAVVVVIFVIAVCVCDKKLPNHSFIIS